MKFNADCNHEGCKQTITVDGLGTYDIMMGLLRKEGWIKVKGKTYCHTHNPPKKFRYSNDGEANFHGIMNENNWMMRIQFNGEYPLPAQVKMIEDVIHSLNQQDVQ